MASCESETQYPRLMGKCILQHITNATSGIGGHIAGGHGVLVALAALATALIAPETAHASLVEQVRQCHPAS